jgi:hypothetical protein
LQSAGQKESSEESQRVVIAFFFSALVRDQCASLSLSVCLCVFLTELRKFLFLFWFSKSRSLERTGIEAWNSLLLDDVHRITEKGFSSENLDMRVAAK